MAKKDDAKTVENSLAYRKYLKFLPDKREGGVLDVMGAQRSHLLKEEKISFEFLNSQKICDATRSLPKDLLTGRSIYYSDFNFKMINSDMAQFLSPAVTSLDKTQEGIVFPSVRRLIRQFNNTVACERISNEFFVTSTTNNNNFSKDSDIVDLVTDSSSPSSGMNLQSSVKCLMQITDPADQSSKADNIGATSDVLSSSPLDSEVDVQKLYSIQTCSGGGRFSHLAVKRDHGLKWRSISDSNLCRKDSQRGFMSRLDSGTSDLSDEGGVSHKNWSRESLNEERSGESLSPAGSSMGSIENVLFNVARPLSCDLCWSSFGKWDRSNSSDSAVIFEDECISSCSSSPYGKELRNQCTNVSETPHDVPKVNSIDNKQSSSYVGVDCSDDHNTEEVEFRKPKLSSSSDSKRPSNTPSVVISDYSGANVSVHVAYASDDFSLNNMLEFSSSCLREAYVCDRKVSDCSTCSSVSTVDMGSGLNNSLDLGLPIGNYFQRRSSDCSSCCLTGSEDEVEVTLRQPSPPPLKKTSHWRKVRNVVQWTPFIQTYKRHKYPWVQLAGHQGNFKAGHRQGTIMKKLCPAEEKAFEAIAKDALQPLVPDYLGVVEGSDCENYLQLQDLLTDFSSACVMDIKMGVRTYLEEELAKARIKPKLRKDMYEKMVQIDGKAPTEAEHKAKAVTKPRYMVWRETISSTATLGFRIEGVRRGDGSSSKDFKTTRTREQVVKAIAGFVDGYPQTVILYIQRLKVIKAALEKSKFFKTHELIGSSLLFVHNEDKSGIWLIDFAKTIPLPDSVKVSHNVPWIEGTHEDGYLIGLDNLIELFECILENPSLLPSNNLKDVKAPEESAEKGLSADTSRIKKIKENSEEGKSGKISNNKGGLENNLQAIVDKDNNTVLKDSGKPHLNAIKDALSSVSSKNVANALRTESLQQND